MNVIRSFQFISLVNMKKQIVVFVLTLLTLFHSILSQQILTLNTTSYSSFQTGKSRQLIVGDEDYFFVQDGHSIYQIDKKTFTLRETFHFKHSIRYKSLGINCLQIYNGIIHASGYTNDTHQFECWHYIFSTHRFPHLNSGSKPESKNCWSNCFLEGDNLFQFIGSNYDSELHRFNARNGRLISKTFRGPQGRTENMFSKDYKMYYFPLTYDYQYPKFGMREADLGRFPDFKMIPNFVIHGEVKSFKPRILMISDEYIYTGIISYRRANIDIYITKINRKDPREQKITEIASFGNLGRGGISSVAFPMDIVKSSISKGKHYVLLTYCKNDDGSCTTEFRKINLKTLAVDSNYSKSIPYSIAAGVLENKNFYFAYTVHKSEDSKENYFMKYSEDNISNDQSK